MGAVAVARSPYPASELAGCESGLCLFAAAFLGQNDAVHFAEAQIPTMCVDVDGPRLAQMAMHYPSSWQFAVDDAWKFSSAARELGEQWDAVSVDPFTGDAMTRSDESLDLWLSLARRTLIVGTKMFPFVTPAAWHVHARYYERANDVYWLVLNRV